MQQNPYHTASLQELQAGITRGDEAAFTRLYELFYHKLTHFSYSLVRSRELAEEVVEDVFVKLWSDKALTAKIENLTVYLYVAVKNRSLNTLSSKAKELVAAPFDYLDNLPGAVLSASPYDLMVSREMMARVQQAVDQLPPRCKMIFRLIREDGLRYKEVAEILNISVNTIDVQMAIAVKKICTALQIEKPEKHPLTATFSLRKK